MGWETISKIYKVSIINNDKTKFLLIKLAALMGVSNSSDNVVKVCN